MMASSINPASIPPPGKCMIDRVPDEILDQIFHDFLAGDMAAGDANPEDPVQTKENVESAPLWLEHCFDLPRFHMNPKVHGWEELPEDIKKRLLSDPETEDERDERLGSTPRPPPMGIIQAKHVKDWLIVNSTCRRFRRIGKPIFFAEKRIMLSGDLAERLQQGKSFLDIPGEKRAKQYMRHREEVIKVIAERRRKGGLSRRDFRAESNAKPASKPAINFGSKKLLALSSQDQALILAEARNIILTGARLTTPSTVVGLPKFLTLFPRLRSCWVMLGEDTEAETGAFKIHRPNEENGDHVCKIAARTRNLLLDIGLSPSLELSFAVSPSYLWDRQEHYLTNETFNLLRVKKAMMNRSKRPDLPKDDEA
ncbi:unnamed protein product [Clonostachys rosea]|uniref:F-box domain-containing protein n=1 Tax=Bionectria ochroleuca TaxID=29856 RepID=A0ABY6UH77_BIOOC|nr:unnamed protein product [Clonostachys rosea]